jgi:hypothetical protein
MKVFDYRRKPKWMPRSRLRFRRLQLVCHLQTVACCSTTPLRDQLLTRVDAKLRSHSSISLSLERGERRAERDEWLELAERAFQIKVRRLRVLAYMAALPAAGDRGSNARLMKKPRNCDLSDGRTEPFRNRTYSVGDGEAPLDFPGTQQPLIERLFDPSAPDREHLLLGLFTQDPACKRLEDRDADSESPQRAIVARWWR